MVAVLLIHIDSAAAAIMNPNTTDLLPPPPSRATPRTTPIATFLCAPLDSIARLIMNPHIKSMIKVSPYECATSLCPITPNVGKTASGIRLVAGTGTGSNTHHTAHNVATPTTIDSWIVNPSIVWQHSANTIARIGPATKAMVRMGDQVFDAKSGTADISYILLT